MAQSVGIPQDIIDNVIAAVGDDERLLKKCALVSSSFLLPTRKQLFSRISLSSDQACQRLYQFLVQNQVIQSFIRTIALVQDGSWGCKTSPDWELMNSTSLPALLRLPFCCLESFSIGWACNPLNWNSFSSELTDALSHIIHSSTLKTLSLVDVSDVPITLFLDIVHLTTLELHSLSPSSFYGGNSTSLTREVSKGAATTASHTVIDRCVWHFEREDVCGTRFPTSAYFSLIGDKEGSTEPIFLPFMCHLRFFEIYISLGSGIMYDFEVLSFLIGSLCVSLTSPATLKHLEFNIRFRGGYDMDNDFDSDIFYENLRGADVWSHLDSIITRPTGSRLQQVDINIYCSYPYDYVGEGPEKDRVLKAVLDGLPFLRTEGILRFVEVTFEE